MTPTKVSKQWGVLILESADQDIDDIVGYLEANESVEMGERIFDRIEEAIRSLSTLPERGRIPLELQKQTLAYREIQVHPYRVIHEVDDAKDEVAVHLVLDGRRNTAGILQERLLRPPL